MSATLYDSLERVRRQGAELMGMADKMEAEIRKLRDEIASLSGSSIADKLIAFVGSEFGVMKEELMSIDRHDRVAFPRQVVMALAIEVLGMSTTKAAALVNRTHQTAIHAVQSVNNRQETCRSTRDRVQRVTVKVQEAMQSGQQ